MAFTIAISGCSSAGKSTLAFLLAEIFADGAKLVPIIHGDAYFMQKHLCPLATYTSTPSDSTFCQLTLNDDRIGEYVLSWDGNLSRTKAFTVSGPDTDCNEAINFVRMFDALKKAAEDNIENVAEDLGTMKLDDGADNNAEDDAEDDVDIKSDINTDIDFEDGGAPLSRRNSEDSEGGVALFLNKQEVEDLAPSFPHITIDVAALHTWYSVLISQMQAKVQDFLAKNSKDSKHPDPFCIPPMQIIEAFQLFSEPSTITADDSSVNTTHLLHDLHINLQKLSALSTALAEADDVNPALESSRSKIESNIQTINSTCKRGMSSLFSVKLWLSTSQSAAKTRRFERPVYIDLAAGGLREPGQMWKTEGYFDQIAWKNHVESHEWLIGEDGVLETGELGQVREGVHVRAQDLGVEDTVRWAIGAVLEEMGKVLKADEKDEGKDGCGGCEGCDRKACEWI